MSGEKTLADSVIDRLKKKPEELSPLENGQLVKVQRGEMFSITCAELAAVLQKNPHHPCAAAYRKAVAQNPPDEKLTIEKIDLEALLDNREVIISVEEGETDVEGIKMKARYETKKLGQEFKKPLTGTSVETAQDPTPNQPGAVPTAPRHKIGGSPPAKI